MLLVAQLVNEVSFCGTQGFVKLVEKENLIRPSPEPIETSTKCFPL
jgi:hypothetical protein